MAVEHWPPGALQGWGLIGYMQDEVEQSQLTQFPDPLQPLQGLLGMNFLIFTMPDLEQPGLRSQEWVMAQGRALELGDSRARAQEGWRSQRWRVGP